MSDLETMLDGAVAKIAELEEAIRILIRGLENLAADQKVQSEMLGKTLIIATKIHAAVTRPASADGGDLGKLLRALVDQGEQNARMLRSVLEALHVRC